MMLLHFKFVFFFSFVFIFANDFCFETDKYRQVVSSLQTLVKRFLLLFYCVRVEKSEREEEKNGAEQEANEEEKKLKPFLLVWLIIFSHLLFFLYFCFFSSFCFFHGIFLIAWS